MLQTSSLSSWKSEPRRTVNVWGHCLLHPTQFPCFCGADNPRQLFLSVLHNSWIEISQQWNWMNERWDWAFCRRGIYLNVFVSVNHMPMHLRPQTEPRHKIWALRGSFCRWKRLLCGCSQRDRFFMAGDGALSDSDDDDDKLKQTERKWIFWVFTALKQYISWGRWDREWLPLKCYWSHHHVISSTSEYISHACPRGACVCVCVCVATGI